MRNILLDSNTDLCHEVERLVARLTDTTVIPELAGYHDRVLRACMDIREQVLGNLQKLELGRDDIIPEILSETQRLARELRLYNQRLAGPALRGLQSDRLSLRVLNWLHAAHKDTTGIPAAVSTDEFGIWPAPPHPVIYFMPASAQGGLLYQALFFHEFGHLLYSQHEPEMASLVRDLQLQIAELLEPLARLGDVHSQAEARQRAVIVVTWYRWIQELFCDAVGIMVGGPAFIHAFSRYLRVTSRNEFHCQPDELELRPHPVTWLRIRLLSRRARSLDCGVAANATEAEWGVIASSLGIAEDYYGFYSEEFLPVIWEAIEHMLVEAAPYRFTQEDLGEGEWTPTSTPVHLLNRAWREFQQDPEQFMAWESQAVAAFCDSTPPR